MTDEYEFGVEGEEEAGGTLEEGSSRRKEGVKPVRRHFHRYQIIIIIIDIDIDTVEIIISFHQVKRLKGGRQLKSVRVRVEKLQGKRQVMTMTMTMKGCPLSNSLWQKQKSIIISFQWHPVVGHILVLSCYLFFAPERRKIFSRNRKNIFSRCYVIGSLPPAPAFMRVLEAIKGIGPVPEELPAGAFSPINMTAAVLNK